MKDVVYLCRGNDRSMPLSFIEKSIELVRIQAMEHNLDRVHLWMKLGKATRADPDDMVIAVMWSVDETPPASSYDLEDFAYFGVFTLEQGDRQQKIVAQSGAAV
jgi:hypothetical protein